MQHVSIGRIVHFFESEKSQRQDGPIAAIVTSVVSEEEQIVTLTIFPKNSASIALSYEVNPVSAKGEKDKENLGYWDWPEKK